MKLLILGSKGYIGKHFVASTHITKFNGILAPSYKSEIDLLDLAQLTKYLKGAEFDLIMNCTGYLPHRHQKNYGYEINRFGSANLVKALQIIGKSNPIIHFSSATEIRVGKHTESEYSLSKIEVFENLLEANIGLDIPIIQVVLHNIVGRDPDSNNFLNTLITSAELQLNIKVKFPHRMRDFVWIDDCIDGIAEVLNNVQQQFELQSLPPLSRYEIGNGIPISLYELAVIVYKLKGAPVNNIKIDQQETDLFPSIFANVAESGCMISHTSIETILRNVIGQEVK